MKKLLSIALVVMMLFALCACGAKEEDKLVVGYTIYEPMNYMDAEGNFVGFDTEFALAVGEKLGREIEFVEINWDTKFVTLESDQIDCIWNGMTISDDVKANCIVSDAYVKNAQVVVLAEDKVAEYADVESLKALTFTAEAGSAGEAAIKDNGLDNGYKAVATQAEALLAVKGGQADACVIDITMAKAMTKDGTDYADLDFAVELTTEEYGIGFRKADTDLRDKVNAIIAELNEDGTLPALAEKYSLNLAF